MILVVSQIMDDIIEFLPDMIIDDIRQELYVYFLQCDWKINSTNMIDTDSVWKIVSQVCAKACGSAHYIEEDEYEEM